MVDEERPENPLKPLTEEVKERIEVIRNASIGFLYDSTPANLMFRFLTDALLLQYYFIINNIPYVFHWVEYEQFDYLKTHYALSDMSELLQRDHFIQNSNPSKYWMDKAADNAHHPGPESNNNIAEAMFQKVLRTLWYLIFHSKEQERNKQDSDVDADDKIIR